MTVEMPYEYHVSYFYVAEEPLLGSPTATVTRQGWACRSIARSHPIDSSFHIPLIVDFLKAHTEPEGGERMKIVEVVVMGFILFKRPSIRYRVKTAFKESFRGLRKRMFSRRKEDDHGQD